MINRTQVDFVDSAKELESFFKTSNIILIDKKLKKNFSALVSKASLAAVYFLEGSENTKSFQSLNSILDKIFTNKKFELNKKTKLIVIGGGTLGDFGGFLAHILKRGLDLVLVPSTWLSAMDSAHGGKNGINFKQTKNQLGTIYPAKQVIVVRSLLEQQDIDRTVEGFGELIKISYIHSPRFFEKVSRQRLSEIDLFQFLPLAIDAKYQVVKKDPYETKGVRYLLNFGHTIAHVWEAKLGIHHGIAVILGLYFDFLWAHRLGYPVSKDLTLFYNCEIVRGVLSLFFNDALFSISEKDLRSLLTADKKKENQNIKYVFPKGGCRLVIEPVSVDQIVEEYRRQKELAEDRLN